MAEGIVDSELEADNRPGLIRSANVVVSGSDEETTADGQRTRWVNGFSFDPDPCGGGHIVDPCQLGTGADAAGAQSCDAVTGIQPYIIESLITRSTFDNRPDYYRTLTERKLYGIQSKVLETEFWAGAKAISQSWTKNQYLANPTGLTILQSGSAMGIIDGLAALEQAAADNRSWGRSTIHATPRLVTHWISQQLVKAIPNPPGTLQTQMGTIVIAGAGYPGTGPGGSSGVNLNHLQWAFVTPIPDVRLGAVTYNETDTDEVAVTRSANDRRVRVARFAAATMSPCYRACALINMTTSLAVPGS